MERAFLSSIWHDFRLLKELMLHLILALNALFQAGIHYRNFLYENHFFSINI